MKPMLSMFVFLLVVGCSKPEEQDTSDAPPPVGDTDTDIDTGEPPPPDPNGVYTGTVSLDINNLGTGELIACTNGAASITVNKTLAVPITGSMSCEIPDPTGTNTIAMTIDGTLENDPRADGTILIAFGIEPEEISWSGELSDLQLAGNIEGETSTPPWVTFSGAFSASKSEPLPTDDTGEPASE